MTEISKGEIVYGIKAVEKFDKNFSVKENKKTQQISSVHQAYKQDDIITSNGTVLTVKKVIKPKCTICGRNDHHSLFCLEWKD